MFQKKGDFLSRDGGHVREEGTEKSFTGRSSKNSLSIYMCINLPRLWQRTQSLSHMEMPRPHGTTTHPVLANSSEYISTLRWVYQSTCPMDELSGQTLRMWHQVVPLWEVEDHPTARSRTQLPHLLPDASTCGSRSQGEDSWKSISWHPSQEKCLLSDAIYDYTYVSQGRTKVSSSFYVLISSFIIAHFQSHI